MFAEAMNYFYYRASINELRWMNDGNEGGGGLTYNSLLYLNIIAYTADCTISKLAEIVRITKPAVTIKVNELVKRGCVIKEQSATDKRVFYLHLSPSMEMMYGMYDRLGVSTEQMLLARYSAEDLELFSKMLHDVADYEPEEA